MAIKTPKGYRTISGVSKESLDTYIQSFTFGSGETILVGRSDTLDTTITRGTRTSDGAGNALQIAGGTATGTNQVGGDVEVITGYPTGNAAAGDFIVRGALVNGSSGTTVNPSNSTMFSVSGDTGDATFANDITNQGSDNDLSIVSDGNIYFEIDRDADEASKFSFAKHGSTMGYTEVAKIDESGNLQIDGSLTVGSTEVINSSAQFSASAIPTLDSNKVKQIVTTHHCFTISAGGSAQDFWVPFIGTSEQATPNNTHRTVAPYDGLIKRIVVHATGAFDSSAQVRYHKINGGDTDDFANDNSTDDTTTNVTVDLSTAYTAATADFSSGNTFSAGDQIGIGLVRNNSTTGDVAMTVVWEYTIS